MAELRAWLEGTAGLAPHRVGKVLSTLRAQWIDDLAGLRANIDVLEKHLPAAAYSAIAKGLGLDLERPRPAITRATGDALGDALGIEAVAEGGVADADPGDAGRCGSDPADTSAGSSPPRPPKPPKVKPGLPVKFVWEGHRFEFEFAKDELQRLASVNAFVRELAKRGTALHAGNVIKPSAMRVEYKLYESKTGVKRRVALTPQSDVVELKRADSILVRPYDQ